MHYSDPNIKKVREPREVVGEGILCIQDNMILKTQSNVALPPSGNKCH